MNTRITYISLMLFASTLFIACSHSKENGSDSENQQNQASEEQLVITQSQFESSGMQLGDLKEITFSETVQSNGYINVPPQNRASVSVFFPGYVKKSTLLMGDKVQKGQVLFTLENVDYIKLQQDYLESAQQLRYLQAEYKRQNTLAQENISSSKNQLKAETDYKMAQAKTEALRKELQLMSVNLSRLDSGNISTEIYIYAPISGFISKHNISLGLYLEPKDVAMEIINPEHMHLELSVFEKNALKIQKGQLIHFRLPDVVDLQHDGTVILVGKTIEDPQRTISVHGHMAEEAKNAFIPGMYIEAEIVINQNQAHALPNEAIVGEGDQAYVFHLKEQKGDEFIFEKIPVVLGRVNENFTEVVGEHPITNVLVNGAFNLAKEL